jgi:putative hydrolase of the HAD superfamily
VRVAHAWVEERFRSEWARRNGLASLKSDKKEKAWWRALVRRVFGTRFAPAGFHRYYEELHALFAHPKTWRLFPDALPTLKALGRRGVITGIVSNWDSRLFRLCDGLGVKAHVKFILASAVEGAVKPDKAIFQRALKHAGADKGRALHVGDSYREDYWGATRAGLSARLLVRRGPAPAGARVIRSLAELLHIPFPDAGQQDRPVPPPAQKLRP